MSKPMSAKFDQRHATIIGLRFFFDQTFEEITLQLGCSTRNVKREWTMARSWLHQQLAPLT
jgi:DNA-directed RNA polymerase specialized sigma subunit